jgi:Zn finger protein HypA/HybF involved in hydrogenase expression
MNDFKGVGSMKCFTCKTEMKCTDDINEETVRIDWLECPKCNSNAYVSYGNHGEYIEKVVWKRS